MNKPLILVVEDDAPVRSLITTTLRAHDYRFLSAANGESAILEASSHNPDIMLLDLGLPDLDGVEVIHRVRTWSNLPIIVISARSEDTDKIEALDAGADDYVPKPFRMMELLSRIRALIRRAEGYNTLPESEEYHIDGLELSPSRHLVRVNGQEIALTFKEFELLCLLVENRGIVLSRDKILDKVWQDTMGRESRTVDVHIRTLRHKLGTIGGRIETVRGVGYKFKAEE